MLKRMVVAASVLLWASAVWAPAADAPVSQPSSTAANAAPASTRAAAGFTRHDFLKALLEYNRRTLSEAYRQVGHRDPKWDAQATKFLDLMALRFTLGDTDAIYSLPGADTVSNERLLPMGEAIRKSGCDDPMFLYCYAAVLHDSGRDAEAAPLFDQGGTALMSSQYPITRALNAAARQFLAAKDPKAQDATWAKFRDSILATLTSWDFKNLDRRIIWYHTTQFLGPVPASRLQDLVDSTHGLIGADPWLTDILDGYCEIQLAWAARGNGWANTVTQQGWQQFFAHLTKARDALTAAWKLRPEYPEAARYMITMAMGGSDQLNENPRTWFDRAIKAQIDDDDSYTAYRNAILPRWGGSIPQLQALANQCAATGRFDTDVPWQGVITLEAIVSDLGQPDYWQAPGVYDLASKVCQGYAGANIAPKSRNYYRSYEAAVAWRSGHYDEARKQLDQLGDGVRPSAFLRMRTMPRLAISNAYVMSGPAVGVVRSAEQQASSGQLDAAIAAYQGAADRAVASKDPGAYFLRSRLKQLQWQKAFEAGGTVDITPDADFIGWEQVAGKWHVEKDGTVVGKASSDGHLFLAFQGVFMGPRWKLLATTDLPDSPTTRAAVEFSLSDGNPTGGTAFAIQRGGGKPTVAVNGWRLQDAPVPAKLHGQDVLRMQRFDDRIGFGLHHTPLIQMSQMDRVLTGPRVYIGLGGRSSPDGPEIRFKQIRLRKLVDMEHDGDE